ncbi:MAG TPA: hypothetical protein VLM17_11500 [Xanthomonadaceae bacterium]|nr:hypothetical protein [Xanthomonadaceae bacterium]
MAREPLTPLTPADAAARRRGVLRTVWIMAAIAIAVYVAFLLTGILPR